MYIPNHKDQIRHRTTVYLHEKEYMFPWCQTGWALYGYEIRYGGDVWTWTENGSLSHGPGKWINMQMWMI